MNILSSTTVFSLYTLLSRILGYARDILIAVFLGTSILADSELRLPMLALVLFTPILHRSFNVFGYKIGWKDVPY